MKPNRLALLVSLGCVSLAHPTVANANPQGAVAVSEGAIQGLQALRAVGALAEGSPSVQAVTALTRLSATPLSAASIIAAIDSGNVTALASAINSGAASPTLTPGQREELIHLATDAVRLAGDNDVPEIQKILAAMNPSTLAPSAELSAAVSTVVASASRTIRSTQNRDDDLSAAAVALAGKSLLSPVATRGLIDAAREGATTAGAIGARRGPASGNFSGHLVLRCMRSEGGEAYPEDSGDLFLKLTHAANRNVQGKLAAGATVTEALQSTGPIVAGVYSAELHVGQDQGYCAIETLDARCGLVADQFVADVNARISGRCGVPLR